MGAISRRVSRQRWRAIVALAVVPAVLGIGAGAATAAPSCSSTYACWWADQNYSGTFYGSSLNQTGWPSGIANKDDSVFNNGTSGNAVFTYRYGFNIEVMYCVRKGVAVNAILPAKANKGNSHNWKAADSGCY